MASLGALTIKITGDLTQFNKDIASVEKTLNKQTAGLSKVAKSMTTVGDSMVKGVTVPILAIGAGLLKLGEEFDGAYDKIRIGTGKTGKELEAINDDFREIAKVAPSSFSDIGTAVAGLNSKLGLTGKPLQDLSTQVLNLSRITKTDLNTNIDQAAKLFNNWKISTENQSKTLDMMFRASQNTGIEIGKLMSEVSSSGPILRTMGYDLETSTALIAGFDKAGIDVTSTVAGMKKALVTMAKEGLGDDPQQILSMYIDKIKGAKTEVEAVGIAAELFGARGGAQMAVAIREGRLNLDDLVNSLKNGTDGINAASKATLDWQEQLILLRNNLGLAVEPLAAKVFESLGRVIGDITPKIESLAKSFGNLTPEMSDNILKWGLITAAIPLLISGLGRATTGAIAFYKAIQTMNVATKGILLPVTAMIALGEAIEFGADKLDDMNTKWGEFGAAALRGLNPAPWRAYQNAVTSLSDIFGVYNALAKGTIDITELQKNGMAGAITKLHELKAAQVENADATDTTTTSYRNAGVEAQVFQNSMYGAIGAMDAGSAAADGLAASNEDVAASEAIAKLQADALAAALIILTPEEVLATDKTEQLKKVIKDMAGVTLESVGEAIKLKRAIAELESKTITITTHYLNLESWSSGKAPYLIKGGQQASGGVIGFPSASAGMITPSADNGGLLTMLHKNEVVLNAGQTQNLAKLIFGLANTKTNIPDIGTGSGAVVNIYPQWNQEFADVNTVRLIKQELAKVL